MYFSSQITNSTTYIYVYVPSSNQWLWPCLPQRRRPGSSYRSSRRWWWANLWGSRVVGPWSERRGSGARELAQHRWAQWTRPGAQSARPSGPKPPPPMTLPRLTFFSLSLPSLVCFLCIGYTKDPVAFFSSEICLFLLYIQLLASWYWHLLELYKDKWYFVTLLSMPFDLFWNNSSF